VLYEAFRQRRVAARAAADKTGPTAGAKPRKQKGLGS
jgi:hypothetical protein